MPSGGRGRAARRSDGACRVVRRHLGRRRRPGDGCRDPEAAFEPFFTTKPQGKGSGLGLASVHGTVSQSGGFVRLESEPGEGHDIRSVASRRLPPNRSSRRRAEEQRSAHEAPVVLLAEDEDLVRELVTSVLAREGFEVHAGSERPRGARAARRLGRPLDLLVTDLVMPTMSGRELAERVVERGSRRHGSCSSPATPTRVDRSRTALSTARRSFSKPFSPGPLSTRSNRVVARPVRSGLDGAAVDDALVTCVIADDHPAVLDSVSRYLERCRDTASSPGRSRADEALRAIDAHRPMTALAGHHDGAVRRHRGRPEAGRQLTADGHRASTRATTTMRCCGKRSTRVRAASSSRRRRSPSWSRLSTPSPPAEHTSTPALPALSPRPRRRRRCVRSRSGSDRSSRCSRAG